MIRVLLQFESEDFSWTEAYYWTGASPGALPEVAVAPAVQLANLRVPCLGTGAVLTRMRLSSVPANRAVWDILPPAFQTNPTWQPNIYFIAPSSGSVTTIQANFSALFTNAARPGINVLIRLASADNRWRNLFMGCPPTGLIHQETNDNTGLDWQWTADFNSRLVAFLNFLSSGTWAWLSRISSVGQPATLSAGVAPFAGLTVINVAVPFSFPPGLPNQIIVRGFRRINTREPAVNGLWKVAGVIPPGGPGQPTGYALSNSGSVPINNYLFNGTGAAFNPQGETIAGYYVIGAAERKRGGSLGLPRGRSRIRV